ncbi:hypothetical protein Tsp_14251, partial [Trichinella spiralis]
IVLLIDYFIDYCTTSRQQRSLLVAFYTNKMPTVCFAKLNKTYTT